MTLENDSYPARSDEFQARAQSDDRTRTRVESHPPSRAARSIARLAVLAHGKPRLPHRRSPWVHPPHISWPGMLRNGGPAWTGILDRHQPECAVNCGGSLDEHSGVGPIPSMLLSAEFVGHGRSDQESHRLAITTSQARLHACSRITKTTAGIHLSRPRKLSKKAGPLLSASI